MPKCLIMTLYIYHSGELGLSEKELGTVKIRLGPVLEKLDESCINSNLNRNFLGRKQTVVNLYDFDGNIL